MPSRLFIIAPLMVLASTACTTADESARAGATAAASLPIVEVIATDFVLQAPDTIPSGFTTFRLANRGEQLHMAQLVKIEGDRTLEDFLRAYEHAFRTVGRRPEWAPRRGGPGVAAPGGQVNATQYLEPGRYAWICLMNVPDGIPHVVKAKMAKLFTVRSEGSDSATRPAPRANLTVRMTDYAFQLSGPMTAGRHTIRVENAGIEPHELSVLKLSPGTTVQAFEAWMKKPDGAPPVTPVGGISSIAAKGVAYFDVDLTPGDYLLFCVVTAPDGKPHYEHGMIQHIRVT